MKGSKAQKTQTTDGVERRGRGERRGRDGDGHYGTLHCVLPDQERGFEQTLSVSDTAALPALLW